MKSIPPILWQASPQRLAQSPSRRYLDFLVQSRGLRFSDYQQLWQWSVSDLEGFWSSIWEHFEVRSQAPAPGYSSVLRQATMPGAQWFNGAALNYARQCLHWAQREAFADTVAVIAQSEITPHRTWTWKALAADVAKLQGLMMDHGVERGDRIAAYIPNVPEALIALMASASLGAIWSSASPDMGATSVLDRFKQIEPKVLVAVDAYQYAGKRFDRSAVVAEILKQLPSVRLVIFVPAFDEQTPIQAQCEQQALAFVNLHEVLKAHSAAEAMPSFVDLPFDAPLWIVYSSGTTGMPKPIVHGHGGTIIESLKSLALGLDIKPGDRFFWQTSTSWIMWNSLVSALMGGASILQLDGHPGYPDLDKLWSFVSRNRANLVGISPAYIGMCIKEDYKPAERFDLSSLQTLGSTGSPLTAAGYQWVYQSVGQDLMLASISGGTDPGAAFIGASVMLPVYEGEMQCRCLGSAIEALDDEGKVLINQVGELVCTKPMPSMPLFFWNDPENKRYFGDWLEITDRGTAIIYGRSDSTINRHGIRMGTSELYRVVEAFEEIADALVIDLEYLGRPSMMLLFVVLRAGQVLDEALSQRVLKAIREQLSARHLPNAVHAIADVPRTLSGKKLEVPVKKILLGQDPASALNKDSMANPQSLQWFIDFASQLNAPKTEDPTA
ncbi:MAG: acetoacetate--CoA ligase [Betaproteobacteria bacterium]|nr:acetoacetate--CoA ligase [Betaproteobacteria bacterium]